MNKKVHCLMAAALALWGAESAFGQFTYNDYWTGLADNGLWSDPGNWSLGMPATNANVYLDAANGWSTITITNGVTGYGNTIYGPEWGVTVNIYGSLNYVWMMAPVQNNPAPGVRSIINMYNGSLLRCDGGAAVGLGDQWWYLGGPYVTLNMYGDALVNMTNGAGLWLGGHLNIYDTATFKVGAGGYVNMDVGGVVNDGTRSLNIGGGTLLLPTGWTNAGTTGENSGTVYDWIGRGVLRAYGKGLDTNDLSITDDGANKIVQAVPLGGTLQRVYFKSFVRSTVDVGTFQQATLVGDYPSVSGVLLSSSEPGVNPATFPAPVYTSSIPQVATIDSYGMVTAISPGTATLTATVGALSSTNSIAITVTPVDATLIHRYSFNGSTADSVGGSPATLMGGATISGGQVVLNGSTSDYVQLAAGIISNLDEVTVEMWASFRATTNNNYENLFAFGFSDLNTLDVNYGLGGNYITFSPLTGGGTAQLNFGQGVPGYSGERDAVITNTLTGQTNMQIVAVLSPDTGTEAFYTNGVLAASVSMFNTMIDPVAYGDPAFHGQSILAYTLGADPNNYLGHSLYVADPGFLGSINECRIYHGPLTASQIAADYVLGPNQLRGTNTNVSLSASRSGDQVVLSWPTSSALVTLESSPTLGTGATWTPVAGTLTASNGSYRVTIPLSGTTRFFRLQY